jgi:hypothetical protein
VHCAKWAHKPRSNRLIPRGNSVAILQKKKAAPKGGL